MSKAPGFPDHFEVVNGPEDGTAYPINRTPVDIGSDGSCAIFIAHDRDVKRFHARVSVVSDGYRIRRLNGGGPIAVEGKRAGYLLSRIVRNGGVVQVGSTEICLQTAPDGLASRSYGMPSESDTVWAIHHAARYTRMAIPFVWSWLMLIPRLAGRHWLLLTVGLGLLYFFRPHAFATLMYYGRYTFEVVRYWIAWLLWRVGLSS